MTTLLAAFQFLTIFPPVVRRAFTPQELGCAVGFFPLVGLAIGGLLLTLDAGLNWFFSPTLSAALILVTWVAVTRGLHLDGFMDSCDGLFGGHTPEARLTIMRDSRIGAFGFAGGALLLLTKFAALLTLENRPAGIMLAPMLGRWGMAAAIVFFPYARQQGLGRDMKDHVRHSQAILATVTVLVASWLTARWLGWLSFVLAGLALITWIRFVLARLPGLTGDTYGAACELLELLVLLIFAISFRG